MFHSFDTYRQDFSAVTVTEAAALLEDKQGAILFLGRASCPYCNRFIPKLHQVAQDKQLTVHFLDTTEAIPELQALRERYQVPTVPGLLIARPTGVEVRCDSSLSEQEIADFLERT